jgi:hypothetical protein
MSIDGGIFWRTTGLGVFSNLMRFRLPIRLLVGALMLTLAAANSGAASMCAACCIPAEATEHVAARPYQQVPSQPEISNASARASHHVQRHRHCGDSNGGAFSACTSRFGIKMNHKADCASPAATGALKEGSFFLGAPRGNAPADVAGEVAWAPGMSDGSQRLSLFASSPTIRIFDPALTRLRI